MRTPKLATLLVAGAMLVAACFEATDDSVDENPPGEVMVAEVTFPLPAADLRATAAEGTGDGDLRSLAATLATLDGVAATEADYDRRSIAVLFEGGLDEDARAGVAPRVAATPGVAAVGPAG